MKWKTGKVANNFSSNSTQIIDSLADAVEGAVDLLTAESTAVFVNSAIDTAINTLNGNLQAQITNMQATIDAQTIIIDEQTLQIWELQETINDLMTET